MDILKNPKHEFNKYIVRTFMDADIRDTIPSHVYDSKNNDVLQ